MELAGARQRVQILSVVLSVLLLTTPHAHAQPSVEPSPAPADTALPQMERLLGLLEGRWTTQATYEPNRQLPDGGTSVGWEESRAGPGRLSIIISTQSHGESGTFEGAGFITWNAAHSSYNLHWLTSSSPEPGFFTGRWSGGNVVFDGYEYVANQRFASRHSITDVSAEEFAYTIDMGSAPDTLKRAVTIRYTRD